MLFANAVYVGLQPAAGHRPTAYAALDGNLRLMALDEGDTESVLAFIAGLPVAVVGNAAPQGPGQHLLEQVEVRRRYDLRPGGSTWARWRVCEYELRRRNIRVPNSSSMKELAPGWMQRGYEFSRRLSELGFEFFRKDGAPASKMQLEAQPHAAFSVLLERQPFAKATLEGRLQRQLVLYLQGLDILNPMRALEEVTRHHLLTGRLPLNGLYASEGLDALAAAYTAYLVAAKPEHVTQVGAPEEGLISLPTSELKDNYPLSQSSR